MSRKGAQPASLPKHYPKVCSGEGKVDRWQESLRGEVRVEGERSRFDWPSARAILLGYKGVCASLSDR
jgi:hypothetical protein